MTINKNKVYSEYISKLEEALKEDNFETIDYILEYLTTSIDEETSEYLSDLIDEITLYSELKEQEYKDEALSIIEENFR